jgi:flagellar biosynthetic protein FliR
VHTLAASRYFVRPRLIQIINLMVGIANKLTPQISVYFISVPMVLAGGFFPLYFTIGESLRLFMTGFMGWLARG